MWLYVLNCAPSILLLQNYHTTNSVMEQGRALSKLLNGHSNLHTLDVSNNYIGGQGGIAIGHALTNNTHLVCLNLRLNR